MLTKTSETAIRALVYLANRGGVDAAPVTPAEIADVLGVSRTYLSKICTLLVKADILRAHRGVRGGVVLSRPPEAVTLLEIVETCQGRILGDYCQEHDVPEEVCTFHEAMRELHHHIVGTLGRWTLHAIARRPSPAPALAGQVKCRMLCCSPRVAGEREAE